MQFLFEAYILCNSYFLLSVVNKRFKDAFPNSALYYCICSHFEGLVYIMCIWQLIKDLHDVALKFICILSMEYMLIKENSRMKFSWIVQSPLNLWNSSHLEIIKYMYVYVLIYVNSHKNPSLLRQCILSCVEYDFILSFHFVHVDTRPRTYRWLNHNSVHEKDRNFKA